jgi:peptide/nickel transport system substrate-binding protein
MDNAPLTIRGLENEAGSAGVMGMARWLGLVVVVLVAALGWIFLRPDSGQAPTSSTAPARATAAGPGDNILRVGVVALPPALGNPFAVSGVPGIYTITPMFDTLAAPDDEGALQPSLALSWEQVDPLTWRFRLRDGVVFHNGVKFTADAVVFTIEHLTSPDARIDPIARDVAQVESAKAVDPLTVEVRTRTPDALLPNYLAVMPIVEPRQWQRLGRDGFAREPVGTGPFKLVRWEAAKAVFAPHEQGWRKPKVAGMEIIAIPDASSRAQAIQSGQLDVAVALGPDDVQAIRQSGGGYTIGRTSGTLAMSLIVTKEGSPLKDVRVRKALNHAIDKQAIIDSLLSGETVVADQPATRNAFGYNPALAPYEYDPAKAKELLAEAGYGPNKKLPILMEVVVGGAANDAAMYQQIAQYWNDVGIAATIQSIPVQQLVKIVNTGDWKGDTFGMNYAPERTMDVLRPIRLHSCLQPVPWYCDERIMPTIREAFAAPDIETRRKLTQEVMRFYHDEAASVFLHEIILFFGHSARVKNFRQAQIVIAYDEIELVK